MSTLYNHQQPLLVADIDDGALPDPVRAALLALFRAAIIYRFSLVWPTVAATTPLAATATAVVDWFPAALTVEFFQQRRCKFPLLLLDRVGTAEFTDETDNLERKTQPWDLNWILGPLDVADLHRFRAALTRIIPDLVNDICSQGGIHSSYNGGNAIFGIGGIPVGSMRLANHNADAMPIAGGGNERLYHGVTMRLETTEYDVESTDDYPDFLHADLGVNVGGFEGLVPGFLHRQVKIGGE
jgi:hypothetical protein